ncbi:MAG: Bug family tripartite tricarboxylate transporter substrate binding protein [Rhodospirillales bacterium]
MNKSSKFTVSLIAAAAALAFTIPAHAADYPNGPIEFVIPWGAGGGADIEGRVLAKEMSKVLGVPVTPVNKIGAGGAISYTYIKNSKPNGQKVVWNSSSVLTTTNIGNTKYDYNAIDHIGRVEYQPQPFAVKASSPWKTFGDFVKACKANPGSIKVANSGVGSSTHTAAIALVNAVGCKVIHLPKGIKGRNKSVLNGESDAMIAPITGAQRLTKAGKLRILAMPTAMRSPLFPNVPTAKELGYDADFDIFRGLSVAPGTPDAIKEKLSDAMMKAANSKAFKGLAKKKGFTIAPMGHVEFTKFLAGQDKIVKAIFKSAGLYKSKKPKK